MLETFTSLFILAVFVEGVIDYFFGAREKPFPWLRYVSAIVSVALCSAYNLDLLATLGLVSAYPWVGYIVTGLVIGRGSNYLNDFIGLVQTKSKQSVEEVSVLQEAK